MPRDTALLSPMISPDACYETLTALSDPDRTAPYVVVKVRR